MLERSTLAILAGGGGTRLGGVAKGLLELEGRSILSRLLELRPAFAEVLLVANDPRPYAAFGLRTVADVVPGCGAPGGVQAALAFARTDRVFAVACDMPFVTRAALEALATHGEGAPLACFEVAGRLEPLLGSYETRLAAEWARRLPQRPSFRVLFEALGGRILPEALLRSVDPGARAVVSLNTPEDLQHWNAGPGSGSKPARFSGEGD